MSSEQITIWPTVLLLRVDRSYFHSHFTGQIKSFGKSDISRTRKYNLAGRGALVKGMQEKAAVI